MDFVIERGKWRCGGPTFLSFGDPERNPAVVGLGITLLLNEEGFMCCLGQIECQLGVDKDRLHHARPGLTRVANILAEKNDLGAWNTTELGQRAMLINDDPLLTQEQREQALTELFAKHGHTLRFEGTTFIPND